VTRLALLDWDGTFRRGFTVRDWVAFLVRHKCISVATENRLAGIFARYAAGRMTHDALADGTARCVARALRGKTIAAIAEATDAFARRDQRNLFHFSLAAFRYFKRHAFEVALVSGAPCEVLLRYAPYLPSDVQVFGLQYETKQGRYTGAVRRNPGVASVKDKIVRRLTSGGPARNFVVAMGNSPSDTPLFRTADFAVVVDGEGVSAFCPMVRLSHADTWTKVSRAITTMEESKCNSQSES
jgi:phosphoserine phosphatase